MKNIIYLCLIFMVLTSFKVDEKSVELNNFNVDVCHKGNVISVSILSLPAHLFHGDVLGDCKPDCDPTSDRDGDGVDDCLDRCPDVWGCPEMSGCSLLVGEMCI